MASMRTIGVRLRMEVSQYLRGAKDAEQATDKLKGKLDETAKHGKVDLDQIATAAGVAGAALTGIAGAAVLAAARFDKQMSEVEAVAGATADEMDRLRQAAIDAGQATAFSATDAAKAEAELAKAGISAADILGGALKGSLALAAAGSLDLADSAEIAAAAMKTFGLGGGQVSHIADVLAAAANKSAAGVDDLGQGLQQVGLVASQVGLTFEETVGVLAAFADRGLKGSDGATSLKTALQRLAAPTGEASDLMKKLGVSMYDATGQTVGAAEIAGQLQTALAGLAPAQRNSALQTIFGSDAIRAANVLYAEGEQGIQDYITAVNDHGAATDIAATKMNNLAGDVEELTGSLETMAITGGGGATAGLRLLTQSATNVVNAISALPAPVSGTITVVTGLSGAALLAGSATLKLRGKLADLTTELQKTGPAGKAAARGLELTTKWGGRAALAVGAVSAAGTAAAMAFGTDLNPQIDALAEGLADMGEGARGTGEVTRLFGGDMSKLDLALRNATSGGRGFATTVESLTGIGNLFDRSWTKNIERVEAMDAALAQLVGAGRAEDAAAGFNLVAARAAAMGISVEDLRKVFPAYFGAIETTARKTSDMAKATAEASEETQNLADAWDELHGQALTLDQAMLDAKKAVDDVAEAFRGSSKGVQGNSRAALENRIALETAAQAAAEAAARYVEQGGSAEGAAKIMGEYKDAAVKATGATGKAKDQVKKLADELFDLPKTTTVNIKVKLPRGTRLTKDGLHVDGGTILRREGGITEHARTGLLREAELFGAMAPARYAFAEPATEGEAFIPKRGDRSRSLRILAHAAGWHGADIVPRGGGYAGGIDYARLGAEIRAGRGPLVENLNVQAWNERFSWSQIERELAYHGVH